MAIDKIAIIGMGLITPLGKNTRENFIKFKQSQTGIKAHQFSDSHRSYVYFGKIEDPLDIEVPKSLSGQYKFVNRGGKIGLISAIEATKEVDINSIPMHERALFLATGDLSNTGCEFMYPANKSAIERNGNIDYGKLNKACLNKVYPFFLLDSISNNPFSFISTYFQFMGDNTSIASLSPSGAVALELACRSLRQGRSSVALVIASTTWVNPVTIYEMQGIGLLSRCKEGAMSFRPLDTNRDGFIPAEGGAALLLETEQSAKKRGDKIHGYILSSSSMCDISGKAGLTVPDMMTYKVIEETIRTSGKDLNEIAFICLHGSGSKKGDRSELKSVKRLFDDYNRQTPLCALKSYTGHMGAGSDLSDLIMSLQFIKENTIAKTLNFKCSDREFSHLPITSDYLATEKTAFITVSNGLGSQSVAFAVEDNVL